jgi:hypothetical protein
MRQYQRAKVASGRSTSRCHTDRSLVGQCPPLEPIKYKELNSPSSCLMIEQWPARRLHWLRLVFGRLSPSFEGATGSTECLRCAPPKVALEADPPPKESDKTSIAWLEKHFHMIFIESAPSWWDRALGAMVIRVATSDAHLRNDPAPKRKLSGWHQDELRVYK